MVYIVPKGHGGLIEHRGPPGYRMGHDELLECREMRGRIAQVAHIVNHLSGFDVALASERVVGGSQDGVCWAVR